MNLPQIDHWTSIEETLQKITGIQASISEIAPISGGDTNQCFRIRYGTLDLFAKINHAKYEPMFQLEFDSLQAIANTNTIKTPHPICYGNDGENSFLVIEYLSLSRHHSNWEEMGRQLANLHRHSHHQFGWPCNNFIGTIPQINQWHDNWIHFWQHNRLGFQLQLAITNRCDKRLQEQVTRVIDACPLFFESYTPTPSLLHGDLWGGNAGFDSEGNPVISDPASYYGDRECDIAMTELFGGFEPSFYSSYREHWPLDEQYPVRKRLYNLYHILNHFNLFGGNYGAQALQMAEQLLAEQ